MFAVFLVDFSFHLRVAPLPVSGCIFSRQTTIVSSSTAATFWVCVWSTASWETSHPSFAPLGWVSICTTTRREFVVNPVILREWSGLPSSTDRLTGGTSVALLEAQRSNDAVFPSGGGNSPEVRKSTDQSLLVYPNAAKDVETLEYPYAELFRDFAAAVCQPNAVVVTYGYGFGDDHVNRVLRDMLTIPSTHLVIISYDGAADRLRSFYDRAGREAQITLLVGSHFGDLATLVDHYLPKPAIDRTTWRMVDLLNRRERPKSNDGSKGGADDGAPEGGESR